MKSVKCCNKNRKRGLTFLVVEDDSIIRKMMSVQLRLFGLKVDVAQNGLEAIQCAEESRYDMIFMDIQMPKMNGLDAAATIRSHELSKGYTPVPIVATTAGGASKQQCLEVGMNEYLVKPVNVESIAQTLHQLLFEAKDSSSLQYHCSE